MEKEKSDDFSDSNDSYDEMEDNIDLMASFDDYEPQKVIEKIFVNLFNSLFGDSEYGSANYWEERYNSESTTYEWFLSWELIYPHIIEYLQYPINQILNIGCGNSTMSYDILKTFPNIDTIINIDISNIVICQMKEKYKQESQLQWKQMDCRNLSFSKETFELVVDKGTIDALYCCHDCSHQINECISEIHKVLKHCGKYICISYGKEELRNHFLESCQRFFELQSVVPISIESTEKTYYVYIFNKQ